MVRTFLAVAGLVVIAACGKGDSADQAAADSLQRDLQMAPGDTGAAMNDEPLVAAPPAQPPAQRPAQRPSQPATGGDNTASSSLTLGAGTSVAANTRTRVASNRNQKGETVEATVAGDIKDSRGRVVIPAGSVVQLTIQDIAPAENRGDSGKLVLVPSAIVVDGRSYPLTASLDSMEYHLDERPAGAGDLAKVGGGAAAGAIVGRVLGGNTKGAVIGGVVGAAVGTGIAIETADRDIVVRRNARIVLTLTADFTR